MTVYYRCDTCNTMYRDLLAASLCESKEAGPCPFTIGQRVMVTVRYGEPVEDTIEGLLVEAGAAPDVLAGVCEDCAKEDRALNLEPWISFDGFHEWYAVLQNCHQLDKSTYTDTFPVDLLEPVAQ